MDAILLTDIELWTRLGVPDEERAKPQRVLVTIELFVDATLVAASDDIAQGIDYERVTQSVLLCASAERRTVEKLAQDIAQMILKTFKPISVRVSVKKFPLPTLASATVTIKRP